MTWLYYMKSKTEIKNLLKGFIAYVERQFDKKSKTTRSDNGNEF